jgi:glutathione synthase/RimK-type ligase-like ATP-grasp enzyme
MISRFSLNGAKEIRKHTGIKMYISRKNKVQALINYGLAGKQLADYYARIPSTRSIPTLNKYVGRSKYGAIKDAKKADILVPETTLTLLKTAKPDDWIEKRIHSVRGIGIRKATDKRRTIRDKYFQKFIQNRKYELRVHAFRWTTTWSIQKRVGPADKIAWNFHQGGRFITVRTPSVGIFFEARRIAEEILKIRKMAFGAVDFIVDKDLNLYFIEVNSAPGFIALSGKIYIDAFNMLKTLEMSDVKDFIY